MKTIMLAATALLAMPALAQTTPPTAPDPAMGAPGSTMPAPMPPATDSTMPTDASTPATPPAGASMPMPMAPGTMTMGPMATNPAPAPAASYPVCSKGVTDQCRERNSRK